MAANPVVTTFPYAVDGARKQFPYEVFMPRFDEPDLMAIELGQQAARLLNAGQIVEITNAGNIKQAHATIGEMARTEMVMVLDADLVLDDGPFKMFPTEVMGDEFLYVHLWHVRNPVNGLEYGHGGPKLFNREQLRTANDLPGVDMTTAFNGGLCIHEECIGTHAFNWSPFSTWRTAVREAAKLTLMTDDEEAQERLQVWLTKEDQDAAYSNFCIEGAHYGNGKAYPKKDISWINDYQHLQTVFQQLYPNDY